MSKAEWDHIRTGVRNFFFSRNTSDRLLKEKKKLINELSVLKKDDILPKPPEPPKKLTLWMKIKKVLMG